MRYTKSSIISVSIEIKEYNINNETQDNKNNINEQNNVFNTKGKIIDKKGLLIQYVLDIGGGKYIIGLENKYDSKLKLSLTLEGLEFTDYQFSGQSYLKFYINAYEKNIFNVKLKNGYRGNYGFQFQNA